MKRRQKIFWWIVIAVMVVFISIMHYTTSTMEWQYHLIYMQSYFIPILIGAFQFGVRGGFCTSIFVSFIYFPHIMLQWGGLVETNLMRFLQIGLFNIIGYLTGLKAQAEQEEKLRYQKTAEELQNSLIKLEVQSAQLSELEEQLRSSDRLSIVGELTASLAHEVRNPLGSIRGATEILRDELPEKMRSSEFFQILIDETNRLNSVLENYLSYSRKQKRQQSDFEVGGVVKSIVQLLNYSARKKNINIKLQLSETSIFLNGDPNHLRQILMNLILNSMQAMLTGGNIFISAGFKKKYDIKNKKRHVKNFMELKLNDEGHGINSEEIEKIFKPFYTTKSNGTGLGLAIVKRLIEENKWHYSFKSKPGVGTEFRLLMPVV